MKSQEFFNIINDIDERFVNEVRDDIQQPQDIYEEVQRPQMLRAERFSPKMLFKPIMCGAACLAVAVAAIGFAKLGGNGFAIISPPQSDTSDKVFNYTEHFGSPASSGKPEQFKLPERAKQPATVGIRDGIYSGFSGVYNYYQAYYSKYSNNYELDHISFVKSLHPEQSCILEDRIMAATTNFVDDCLVLDFEYAPGSDIYALDGGYVVYAGTAYAGVGGVIIIKHSDNDYSVYGYLGELLVEGGDCVKSGDVIAKSGSARDYCDKANYDTTILRLDRDIDSDELHWFGLYSSIKFDEMQNNILSGDELQNYYDIHYAKSGHGCKIYGISSFYSGRDGYSKDYRRIDFNNNDSEIFAMDDGVVTYAGASDFGNLVIIKHADCYSGYGYLDDVLVNEGDSVKADDVIAKSGSALNYCDTLDYDMMILIFYQELTLDNWNGYADLILHEAAAKSGTSISSTTSASASYN